MDTLPDPQSKSSSNVSPHRRDKSRDSLVYLTTCMIGHLVEVHLNNGSVYSGIFHAADVESDFGIVLKMASLIKDCTLRGHKSRSDFFRKPPFKTLIIHADELVQVVAEDLSVSSDGMLNAVQSEKPVELLTDSSISKSRHVDLGRELIPWEPDGNVPQGLDNVFDQTWNRGWDQFKVNESQFGVKSTYDEEQYTTKLSSTQTRELEERARRIEREIEGENTGDGHVAEERGLQLNEKSDIDEETKYSAVRRDDSRFDGEDDKLLDTCNDQTFGGSSTSGVQKSASSSGKGYEDVLGDSQPSRNNTVSSSISESQLGERRENNNPEVPHSSRSAEESVSGHGVSVENWNTDIEEGAKFGGGGTSASKTVAERERQDSQVSDKTNSESSFGQSDSRSSESRPASSTPSRPGLPPSSSIGSLSSSEKSTLKPDAQFKQFEAAMDPDPQSKSSSNVSPHRRDKSRDSLVYLTTCMIGHLVEVHLENGSVYSGIFHAADVENDFGIVLKMASLIKDCTLRGHKSRSEFFRKPPFKTLIIPADELVQVVAEDLSVQSEKPVELLTDSSISKSCHVDLGRELKPCEPDGIPSPDNTNVDKSCSVSGDEARHFPAPGSSSNSESQLDERRKNNNPKVSHNSNVQLRVDYAFTDIKEGAEFSGGGTSASKTVAERERQVSQVSGKTKSESSFEHSDARNLHRRSAPSTPTRPGILPSSPIGSLSSSGKSPLKPDAKEFKSSQSPAAVRAQSPVENTSFYCPVAPVPQIPVHAQPPMVDGYYCYPTSPNQQMPRGYFYSRGGYCYHPGGYYYYRGGYGMYPQYIGPGQQYGQPGYPQMDYYTGQQYGQPGYPQYAQAQNCDVLVSATAAAATADGSASKIQIMNEESNKNPMVRRLLFQSRREGTNPLFWFRLCKVTNYKENEESPSASHPNSILSKASWPLPCIETPHFYGLMGRLYRMHYHNTR
ncbi:unnamed protein product [Eruca vesicaria subsp. sativa]|uniref:Sm domain-containing protein n=1 Tax=Eruca vesicaria subsp. sativa TaxID=29727 RepID=A0ABC8IR03_ERUVS|nr:unnamed protein product [Eruca vesicaria subsp. sativa]